MVAKKDGKVLNAKNSDAGKVSASQLKDKFKAGSIPLQTDFADLIDMADIGYKAMGQAEGQTGLGDGLLLDESGLLKLKIADGELNDISDPYVSPIHVASGEGILAVDLHEGLNDNGSGITVKAGNGIKVDINGVSITPGCRVVPVGTIVMWPGISPPSGWLLCDGSKCDSTKYPLLAEVFGKTGEFTLPDFRSRYPVGADSSNAPITYLTGRTGIPDGLSLKTSVDGEHTHKYYKSGSELSDNADDRTVGSDSQSEQTTTSAGSHSHTVTATSTYSSSQTRPNSISMNFIIACDM